MNGRRFLREDYEVVRYMLGNEDRLAGLTFLTNGRTGKMHQEQFRMWLDGASYRKIAEQFCVTPECIRNHLMKTGRLLMSRYLDEQEVPSVSNIDKFYDFIGKVATDLGLEGLAIRAANAFVRSQKDWDHTDFLKALNKMSMDEILNLNGIGVKSARILCEARTRSWYVCDRCGKELFKDYALIMIGNVHKHLCHECSDKLLQWLDDPEGGLDE